jgi:hypothetical protein
MTIKIIEPKYYKKIQKLTINDFTSINMGLYTDYKDTVLPYILNHLDRFFLQETLSEYNNDYSAIFLWDITNNKSIPFIVGLDLDYFQQQLNLTKQKYISISLDVIDNKPTWNLYIFTYHPFCEVSIVDSYHQHLITVVEDSEKYAQTFMRNFLFALADPLYK